LRYIDNLHFLADPSEFINGNTEPYTKIAEERFLANGWEGDGTIQLLWLPSFVFPGELGISPEGVVLWHVKQEEDGVSFILSPIELPFEKFQRQSNSPFQRTLADSLGIHSQVNQTEADRQFNKLLATISPHPRMNCGLILEVPSGLNHES
jgi:hypothetical protein